MEALHPFASKIPPNLSHFDRWRDELSGNRVDNGWVFVSRLVLRMSRLGLDHEPYSR
jgi:hypothetical protein